MFEKIMPELPLDDVPAGVAYYRDVLGFKVNYAQHDIGVMDRDDVRILLIARTRAHRGAGSCYVYVSDADALRCAGGVTVVTGGGRHGRKGGRRHGGRAGGVTADGRAASRW